MTDKTINITEEEIRVLKALKEPKYTMEDVFYKLPTEQQNFILERGIFKTRGNKNDHK